MRQDYQIKIEVENMFSIPGQRKLKPGESYHLPTKVLNFDTYDQADKAMQRMAKWRRQFGEVVIEEPDLFYSVKNGTWTKVSLDF